MTSPLTTKHKLLLLFDDGGIRFDERYDFDENIAGPLSSPYTEGRGSLTLVQDDGEFATSDGDLVNTVQTTPVWGDLGAYTIAYTRESGRSLIAALNLSTWEELGVGFNAAEAPGDLTSVEHSIYAHSTDGQFATESIGNIFDGLSLNTDYRVIQMLRAVGAWTILDDGNTWQLIDVNDSGSNTPLHLTYSILDGVGKLNTLRTEVLNANLRPNTEPLSDSYSLIPTIADSGDNGLDSIPVRAGLDGSAAFFNGSDSFINEYSAAFDTFFDGQLGTMVVRVKVANADVWRDGSARQFIHLGVDGSNRVRITKSSTDEAIEWIYTAGATTELVVTFGNTTTDPFSVGATWNLASDRYRGYFDGSQVGSDQTGLGTWAGSLGSTLNLVGAQSTAAVEAFSGFAYDAVIANTEASIADMATLHTKLDAGTLTSTDLDGFFGAGNWKWEQIDEQYASDGLGHLEADGVGSGKNRNGATFSSAGNKRYNGAVGDADVIVNGTFDADTDWDKGTGWTIAGNKASKAAGVASDLGQTVDPLTAGVWGKLIYTVSGRTAGAITPLFGTAAGVARSTNATFMELVRADGAPFAFQADSSFDGDVSVVSLAPYSIADLLDLVETSTPDVVDRVNLTITADTPGGRGIAWDSISDPQNGLVVYVDRAQAKVRVDKYLAGAFSSNLVDQALTYGAAQILEVHLSDSDSDGTYTLRTYYNRGNKAETTFSDADIIGNTIHGLFGLVEGGFAEKENVWAKDLGTQYDKFYVGVQSG